MPTPSEILGILDRFLRGESLSDSEREELKKWLFAQEIADQEDAVVFSDPEWEKDFTGYLSLLRNRGKLEEEVQVFSRKAGFAEVGIKEQAPVRSIFRRWGWVAAFAALVAGAAAYSFLQKNVSESDSGWVKTAAMQVEPGKDGAILTLADGSTVVLDSLGNGLVAVQSGFQASIRNGELVYNATQEFVTEPSYNTVHTPKGRQFSMVFADGTRVWLNAASSIRFPTVFFGRERKVEVTGEAYFEISPDAKLPFRVLVDGRAEVEVLGTTFNVNAYPNEGSINTTLIDGSVRVFAAAGGTSGNSIILRPGQQAQLSQGTQPELKLIEGVDVDRTVAWRNGLFNFNNIDFAAAMRQLERWYDINVVYENGIPKDIELYGSMTRDVALNDLLIGLQKIGVKCRLEGRDLIILK